VKDSLGTTPHGSLFHSPDWPHGLRCAACGDLFTEGQPIAERLEAFQDDMPILVLTCVRCDVEGRPLDDD
jgi:hypothetical protein